MQVLQGKDDRGNIESGVTFFKTVFEFVHQNLAQFTAFEQFQYKAQCRFCLADMKGPDNEGMVHKLRYENLLLDLIQIWVSIPSNVSFQ